MKYRRSSLKIIFFIISLIVSANAYSQIVANGMVADSATFHPLSDVNIQIKNKHRGTVTNNRGFYVIEALPSDSIEFSFVGFHSKIYRAEELKNIPVVYLKQEQKLLRTIEFNGVLEIPWLPKIPPFNPIQNRTIVLDPFKEPPGFRGIQTFGPGYIFSGPFSRFSKDERERKKLKRIKNQNEKAKGYAEIVNDPEVKDKIIKDYQLSDDEYFRLLAIFNEKNKDIIYELEQEELISLLFLFYSENAKKK